MPVGKRKGFKSTVADEQKGISDSVVRRPAKDRAPQGKVPLHVRVSPEEHALIKAEAESKGLSMAVVTRLAIQRYFGLRT